MTESEKQQIINEVLDSLKVNSLTIEQLVEVASFSSDDCVELTGGRRISLAMLKELFNKELTETVGKKLAISDLASGRGESTTTAMTQAAVTQELVAQEEKLTELSSARNSRTEVVFESSVVKNTWSTIKTHIEKGDIFKITCSSNITVATTPSSTHETEERVDNYMGRIGFVASSTAEYMHIYSNTDQDVKIERISTSEAFMLFSKNIMTKGNLKLAYCGNGYLKIDIDNKNFTSTYKYVSNGGTHKNLDDVTKGITTSLENILGIFYVLVDYDSLDINTYMYDSVPDNASDLYLIATGYISSSGIEVYFSTSKILTTEKEEDEIKDNTQLYNGVLSGWTEPIEVNIKEGELLVLENITNADDSSITICTTDSDNHDSGNRIDNFTIKPGIENTDISRIIEPTKNARYVHIYAYNNANVINLYKMSILEMCKRAYIRAGGLKLCYGLDGELIINSNNKTFSSTYRFIDTVENRYTVSSIEERAFKGTKSTGVFYILYDSDNNDIDIYVQDVPNSYYNLKKYLIAIGWISSSGIEVYFSTSKIKGLNKLSLNYNEYSLLKGWNGPYPFQFKKESVYSIKCNNEITFCTTSQSDSHEIDDRLDNFQVIGKEFTSSSDANYFWVYSNYDGSVVKITEQNDRTKIDFNEFMNTFPMSARIPIKVGVVGDSYSEGYIKLDEEDTTSYDKRYSWAEHMNTLTGRIWINFAKSGSSTKSWVEGTSYSNKEMLYEEGNKCQVYTVLLQINDSSESMPDKVSVGSIDDIGTENETYYGYYYRLVQMLFEINPNAKIILNTRPNVPDSIASYNTAVRDVVKYCKEKGQQVFLCDLDKYSDMYSKLVFDYKQGHYTSIGYEGRAEIYLRAMSKMINDNYQDWQDIHKVEFD